MTLIERLDHLATAGGPWGEEGQTILAAAEKLKLFEAEHKAGESICRTSPDESWERWVDACDAVRDFD